MNRLLFLIGLNFITTFSFAQKTVKALFIGNSYTGVNDLPLTIKNLAGSNGDSLIYQAYTPGGYTLQMHSVDATTLSLIAQGGWDYVIFQAQSQEPSFSPSQVATDVLPYAQLLDSMTRSADTCTETVFYMTWGRKNGDASNCPFYPPVCTYAGMQQRLRDSYLLMAQQNHASVAPVGCVWREVRATNPSFDLYQADESHPSVWGTYLAACTFYNVLFQKSPVGATYYSSIPQGDAQIIQQITAATVADSLNTWCGNGDIPFAAFTKTITGATVQFDNISLNGQNYFWDFGDGITDTVANPNHTYIQNGTYVVKLTVTNNCKSMMQIDTVIINSVGIENNTETNITLKTLPHTSQIIISGLIENKNYNVFIFDVTGKQLINSKIDFVNNTISFNQNKGIYFYKVMQGNKKLTAGKFIF